MVINIQISLLSNLKTFLLPNLVINYLSYYNLISYYKLIDNNLFLNFIKVFKIILLFDTNYKLVKLR